MLLPAISGGLVVVCYPLFVVPWIMEFHVLRSTVMAGFGIGNLVMACASPVVGWALARIPVRRTAVLGGIALAGGFLLVAVAHSFWQIILLYSTIIALGAAFTGILVGQSVAISVMPEKTGTISGLITLSLSAGGILVPLALTIPITAFGWRSGALMASAIVVFTIVPAAWFFLRGKGGNPPRSGHGPASGAEPPDPPLTVGRLVWRIDFLVPLLLSIPAELIIGTVMVHSVAIATDSGITAGAGGYLVPALSVGAAVGSLGVGWLADRADYRLIFAGLVTGVVIAIGLLVSYPTVPIIAIAFAIVGILGGGLFPLLGVIVVRGFGPQRFGRVMGVLLPVIVASNAAGPVLAGWVRDSTGSYGLVLVCYAALLGLCALALSILRLTARNIAPTDSHGYNTITLPGAAAE